MGNRIRLSPGISAARRRRNATRTHVANPAPTARGHGRHRGVQVLATLTDPAVVRAILTHVGAPTEVPAVAAARAPQVPGEPGGCDPPADLDAYDPV
jgi:hypothetical protein